MKATIKDLKLRLKTTEYYYLVFEKTKTIIEFTDWIEAQVYHRYFGGKMYLYYPYKQFGYDDPYTFTEEWTLMNRDGETIKYDWSPVTDMLVEVTYSGSF